MEERVMSVRLDPTAEEFTPTNHHRIPPHLSTPPPPQGILSLHFYCHLTHAIRTYPLFHPALPPHPIKFFHPSPISETLPLSSPPPPPPQRRRFSPRSSQPQLSHNKTTLNRGSPNNIPNSGSIASSMSSLTLTGEVKNRNGVEQQQHSNGPARKSFIRKHSCETTVGSTRQQQLLPRRNKKGKQAKKHETQFLIKEDAIVESGSTDSRTTLMIKNIPNKYSCGVNKRRRSLLRIIDLCGRKNNTTTE